MSFSSEEESSRKSNNKRSNASQFYAVPSPGVDLFKLDNDNTYKNVAVVSALILYERSDRRFSLQFNDSNRQTQLQVSLTSKFKYDVQENGGSYYGSFLDLQNKRWSIRFASKEISEIYVTHLSYAIFSSGSRKDIFTFELQDSNGEEVREGDIVGTRWTGYSVSISGSGISAEQFRSNSNDKSPQRYTLGAGNVIDAWDRGTVGLKRGAKRIVVTPSSLVFQNLEPYAPKDRDLIFVIELERIKRGKGPIRRENRSNIPTEIEDDFGSGARGQVIQDAIRLANSSSQKHDDHEMRNSNNRSNDPFTNNFIQQQHLLQQQQQQIIQQQQQQILQQQQLLQPPIHSMGVGPSNALVLHNPYGPPTLQPSYNPQMPYYGVPPPVQPPIQPPAPAPPANTTTYTPELIQVMVDERTNKQQINSKLDIMVAKVEQLKDRTDMTFGRDPGDIHVASGISAKALMQTIQRIVMDNDRMQKDSDEKSGIVEKLRGQIEVLIHKNKEIVDKENEDFNNRSKTYQDASLVQKKKLEQLTDLKESLQIEVSNAAADLNQAGRRYETLKKQALGLNEEFNNLKEELENEKSLRDKDKKELENIVQELNLLKQKYRDDNKRTKEATQEREEAISQLVFAKETIDRLTKLSDERTQQLSKDKVTVELSYITERNNLLEQIESVNKEIRNERISATKRIQESQELFDLQLRQQIEELRGKAHKELDRRVGISVERALANAVSQSEETKQRALNEARSAFNEERDRASKILQESFNNRLQEEIKSAYEKGRQMALMETGKASEAALLQLREIEFENLKQSLESEIENQKKIINTLSVNSKPSRGGGYSLERLTQIVKGIVNETFKAIRDEFNENKNYLGSDVMEKAKKILVSKTIGGIPTQEEAPVAGIPQRSVQQPPQQQQPQQQQPVVEPPQTIKENHQVSENSRHVSETPVQQQHSPEPVKVVSPRPDENQQPEPVKVVSHPESKPEPVSEAVVNHSIPDTDKHSHQPASKEPVKEAVVESEDSSSEESSPAPVVTSTKPAEPAATTNSHPPKEPETLEPPKSQTPPSQPDKPEDNQDWDEEPAPVPQPVVSEQPVVNNSGPPPPKKDAFAFLNDDEEDDDPFSKMFSSKSSDPLGIPTQPQKEQPAASTKTSPPASNGTNSTTSAAATTAPTSIEIIDKRPPKSAGDDFMSAIGNNSNQKDDPLGIFGTSTTTEKSKTQNNKSSVELPGDDDDDDGDDFFSSFNKKKDLSNNNTTNKNNSSAAANTTTKKIEKDIWGDDNDDLTF